MDHFELRRDSLPITPTGSGVGSVKAILRSSRFKIPDKIASNRPFLDAAIVMLALFCAFVLGQNECLMTLALREALIHQAQCVWVLTLPNESIAQNRGTRRRLAKEHQQKLRKLHKANERVVRLTHLQPPESQALPCKSATRFASSTLLWWERAGPDAAGVLFTPAAVFQGHPNVRRSSLVEKQVDLCIYMLTGIVKICLCMKSRYMRACAQHGDQTSANGNMCSGHATSKRKSKGGAMRGSPNNSDNNINNNNNNNSEDDNKKRGKRQKKTNHPTRDSDKRPLACPFFVLDQVANIGCVHYKSLRIEDVYQHLERIHCADHDIYCSTCYHEFQTATERDMHVIQQNCQPNRGPNRFYPAELQDIKRWSNCLRQPKTDARPSRVFKWLQLWNRCFSIVPPRSPYPYLESVLVETGNSLYHKNRRPIIDMMHSMMGELQQYFAQGGGVDWDLANTYAGRLMTVAFDGSGELRDETPWCFRDHAATANHGSANLPARLTINMAATQNVQTEQTGGMNSQAPQNSRYPHSAQVSHPSVPRFNTGPTKDGESEAGPSDFNRWQ